MLDSSPGHALFAGLRKEMGTTSSQPVQSPNRVAEAAMVASPAARSTLDAGMDDVAASQQLMDEEGTRSATAAAADMTPADMTPSQVDGSRDASPCQAASTQDMLAQSDDAASSPFPFPASQSEPRPPTAGAFMPSPLVIVPDSQVPPQSLHSSPPSPTANHAVPSSNVVASSATKSKRTYKKSKRTRRDRLSRDAAQEQDVDNDEDMSRLLERALSPSHMEAAVAPHLQGAHATPTPKRRKIGSTKSATRVKDLIQHGPHDSNDQDGDLSWTVEKTKLKRVKKPQTPIAKSKNMYEIPDDDPRPTNGHGQTGDDEDSIMREPISSAEDNYLGPLPHDTSRIGSEKREKKKKRKSTTKKATPQREGGKLSYKRKNAPTSTAAERALAGIDHTVSYPPDLRKTGDFTADEEELIRRAIRDYQDRQGLEVPQLVSIIQWSTHDPALHGASGQVSGMNDRTPQDTSNARESTEFWDEMKNIPTKRSFEGLRRHIRQVYHMFKSGAWTEEEDQLLKDLHSQHPNKWKVIEMVMGDRSRHDCLNRWRDYLQYGDKLKSSRWKQEEEDRFIRAITTVAQRDEDYRAEQGLPPVDEYKTKHINWQQVSNEMDNTRSRIQVVAKWKNLQKRNPPPRIQVKHKPRKNRPAVSGLGASDPTPKKRRRPRKTGNVQAVENQVLQENDQSEQVTHSDNDVEHIQPDAVDKANVSPLPPSQEESSSSQEKPYSSQEESDSSQEEPRPSHEKPYSNQEEPHSNPTTTVKPGSSKPTISDDTKMEWGDFFDLLNRLQEHRVEEEDDIDWAGMAEEMATDRDYIWSEGAVKRAFWVLIELTRDSGKEVDMEDLPGAVDDVMDYVAREHGEKIEEYYKLK